MFIIGLIGKNLSHSFSEKYFSQNIIPQVNNSIVYKNYPLSEISEIEKLILSNQSLIGFNVTIPYKEAIIPYLNNISLEAKEIGAVNTVLINRIDNNYELSGFNTDCYGFKKTIFTIDKIKLLGIKAIVFGTGGSSKAVCFILNKLKIPFINVSRIKKNIKNCLTYNDLDNQIMCSYKLLINCTPVGMYPNFFDKISIPYQYITNEHILIDLIYNPEKTLFLIEGEKRGATIINGSLMLKEQAEEAWNIFKTKIIN